MKESCERLNNQAIALAAEGEYDEAIACFMRAITMENQNYLLWFNLGITYRDAGDLKNARSAMEHAFNINPEDEEIIEALAILLYTMNSFDEAMQYCLIGLHLNEQNAHLWNTMGVIFFNTQAYADASEAFEQAITYNPYYYDALFNLRDTYEELGNTAGKEECQRRLKELEER